MIRVAVADDQTLVRQGIRHLLQLTDEFAVVAEAADGVETLELLATTDVDVLLLDLRMPRLDGIGVLKTITRPPTLVLTTATLVRGLARQPPEFERPAHTAALTPRELDVLRMVANGHANREIAELLTLAEGTVKNHISSILAQLGTRDRTRAALRAISLGLIGGPPTP
jgi:DNA-binding NarL/FixJ family response regulator